MAICVLQKVIWQEEDVIAKDNVFSTVKILDVVRLHILIVRAYYANLTIINFPLLVI